MSLNFKVGGVVVKNRSVEGPEEGTGCFNQLMSIYVNTQILDLLALYYFCPTSSLCGGGDNEEYIHKNTRQTFFY